MKISLTQKERKKLDSLHSKSRDKYICDRIKAVLLSDENWSVDMIAQALRISPSTVRRHLIDYQSEQKLAPENGGSSSYLSEQETQALTVYLERNPFSTNREIVRYIESTYGIKYTVSGLHKWLHRHGFSYKKPKGVPHKQDIAKQHEFIKKYEALKKDLKDDEAIVFIDTVHPTQASKLTYGWIRKGRTAEVKTTGSRTRLNIVGALNLADISRTLTQSYEKINRETIVDFLNKINVAYAEKSKIHLILDGAGYHIAHEVKDEAERLNITLHYLPPYSPNLNPIERLWKVMNEHARNNRYFSTATEFRRTIFHFFEKTLPSIASSLSSRLNDKFHVQKLHLEW